jgi:predicted glutamine amidotransferase
MCRLLGIAGNLPLPAQECLKAFYPLCKEGCVKKGMEPGHFDGWGVSGFSGGRAVYFARLAQSAAQSEREYQQAAERAAKADGPCLIAHFRKATGGDLTVSNTHPFHYRDWIFAHNGTLFGASASLPLVEAMPQGQTDSERFFLWLWEQIHAEMDPSAALAALLKKSRDNFVFTSLNFLMSDGEHLWAYRDFGDKRLEKGESVQDRENYYTLYSASVGASSVICSEPLTTLTKNWEPIPPRTLMCFSSKGGQRSALTFQI